MKTESALSPFSAPDRPSECGSRRDRDHRCVQKYHPVDDLQESPPAPETRSNEYKSPKQIGQVWCFSEGQVRM